MENKTPLDTLTEEFSQYLRKFRSVQKAQFFRTTTGVQSGPDTLEKSISSRRENR